MTKDTARRAGRDIALEDMQVGAADCRARHPDDGVTGIANCWFRPFFEGFGAWTLVNECFHVTPFLMSRPLVRPVCRMRTECAREKRIMLASQRRRQLMVAIAHPMEGMRGSADGMPDSEQAVRQVVGPSCDDELSSTINGARSPVRLRLPPIVARDFVIGRRISMLLPQRRRSRRPCLDKELN
jgi:hypothetical protein